MGAGKYIASDTFTVGGYDWAIYFYPDGKNPEDSSVYVSVFIALASDGTDVRALFELTLLDQTFSGKDKVHSHFDRALESGPYSLKYKGSMWYVSDSCLFGFLSLKSKIMFWGLFISRRLSFQVMCLILKRGLHSLCGFWGISQVFLLVSCVAILMCNLGTWTERLPTYCNVHRILNIREVQKFLIAKGFGTISQLRAPVGLKWVCMFSRLC